MGRVNLYPTVMSAWQEWKKKNAEKQAQGIVSPLDFVNPDTEYADKAVADVRMTICNECPHYLATMQCSKCMCFMPAKTKLLHATCPENKW